VPVKMEAPKAYRKLESGPAAALRSPNSFGLRNLGSATKAQKGEKAGLGSRCDSGGARTSKMPAAAAQISTVTPAEAKGKKKVRVAALRQRPQRPNLNRRRPRPETAKEGRGGCVADIRRRCVGRQLRRPPNKLRGGSSLKSSRTTSIAAAQSTKGGPDARVAAEPQHGA
jgi:hypothetical protein